MRIVQVGLIALAVTTSGCRPLYGGKPEKLVAPPKKKRPAGEGPSEQYVDACKADFFGDAARVRPATAAASPLIAQGNQALDGAEAEANAPAKAALIVNAIGKYKEALIKDPYNPEATLKLAVAYDAVRRKGCALALLKRLAELANHPQYESAARTKVDHVVANETWFRGYRNDAMSALGR